MNFSDKMDYSPFHIFKDNVSKSMVSLSQGLECGAYKNCIFLGPLSRHIKTKVSGVWIPDIMF